MLPDRAGDAGWSEDMIEWCTEHMPRWHPISISGYHIREAGSTAQQELAFTLKDGFTYVRAGDRAWPGRRRLRPAALLLLQRAHRLLRGDRQVPGGAPDLGPGDARDLRRQARGVLADALPYPDRRRLADRPAAAGQHHPHRDRGARRRPRRHPVAPHQLLRRGAGPADRGGGADRAPHPAGDRPRDRRHQHDRPARRLLLRRDAHRRDGARGLRVLRPHRRARRHGRGDQAELPPARDRRRLLPLPAGGRFEAADRGRRQRLRARRTTRRSRSSGSTPSSSASRRAGWRRPRRAATRPRSSARSAS